MPVRSPAATCDSADLAQLAEQRLRRTDQGDQHQRGGRQESQAQDRQGRGLRGFHVLGGGRDDAFGEAGIQPVDLALDRLAARRHRRFQVAQLGDQAIDASEYRGEGAGVLADLAVLPVQLDDLRVESLDRLARLGGELGVEGRQVVALRRQGIADERRD